MSNFTTKADDSHKYDIEKETAASRDTLGNTFGVMFDFLLFGKKIEVTAPRGYFFWRKFS
jgi:hypothetical protein